MNICSVGPVQPSQFSKQNTLRWRMGALTILIGLTQTLASLFVELGEDEDDGDDDNDVKLAQ